MPESLVLTRMLNHLFGGAVTALLNALGVHPVFPEAPISDAFALELLIAALLLAFFIAIRLTLSVEKPAPVQQFGEMIHEFVSGQAESIIGHEYGQFQSYITVIFLFILSCNLIGLVPGINSPTELETTTLALALATFVYYNFYGFKTQG